MQTNLMDSVYLKASHNKLLISASTRPFAGYVIFTAKEGECYSKSLQNCKIAEQNSKKYSKIQKNFKIHRKKQKKTWKMIK
jgi:hypothetical protein